MGTAERRARRIGLLCAVLAVAGSGTLASPAAAKLRVLARYHVSISGSLHHVWTLPSSEPCAANGGGIDTVTFHSSRSPLSVIADNGFGVGDVRWGGVLPLIGSITLLDRRTRNPPAPGDEPCFVDPTHPVPDTRGCGTRRLHDALSVQPPIRGIRRHAVLTDYGNFTNTFNSHLPDDVADCETDGFKSFATFTFTRKDELTLPHYPTARQLSTPHRVKVSVARTDHFRPGTTTTRKVTITFTPTR